MPTAFDDKMVPLAFRLIEKRGVSATFTRKTNPGYDPATRLGTNTPTTFTRKIVPPEVVGQLDLDEKVQTGDMKTHVAAKDLPHIPQEKDFLTLSSVTWTLVKIKEVWSGEQIALYTLYFRG